MDYSLGADVLLYLLPVAAEPGTQLNCYITSSLVVCELVFLESCGLLRGYYGLQVGEEKHGRENQYLTIYERKPHVVPLCEWKSHIIMFNTHTKSAHIT